MESNPYLIFHEVDDQITEKTLVFDKTKSDKAGRPVFAPINEYHVGRLITESLLDIMPMVYPSVEESLRQFPHYRVVNAGEVIEPGDEIYSGGSWTFFYPHVIGMKLEVHKVPTRRRVVRPTKSTEEVVKFIFNEFKNSFEYRLPDGSKTFDNAVAMFKGLFETYASQFLYDFYMDRLGGQCVYHRGERVYWSYSFIFRDENREAYECQFTYRPTTQSLVETLLMKLIDLD